MSHLPRFLLLLTCILSSTFTSVLGVGAEKITNAYKILNVQNTASQDDIKRKYRELCLKLHPDKNVHKSDKQRQTCEDDFKQVQRAYSQIGDGSSRREYDSSLLRPQRSNFSGQTGGSFASSMEEELYRAFYEQQRSRQTSRNRRTPFYVNGIDISGMFPANSPFSFNAGGPACVYEETITVPLHELYTGTRSNEFTVRDGPIQRYRAAFRGGAAKDIALRGALSSVALLFRTNVWIGSAFFFGFFHFSLPRPVRTVYSVAVKKGWKSGTRLTFEDADRPGLNVVFVIREEEHERFTREGDDLRVTVAITEAKARKGCTVLITPLSENELPIPLTLKPGQVDRTGQILRVSGRGWPKKNGGKGDLLVSVTLLPEPKLSRKVANRKRKKGKNQHKFKI